MKIIQPLALALAGLGAASLVSCGTMSIPHTKPAITKADFGKTPEGQAVEIYTSDVQ